MKMKNTTTSKSTTQVSSRLRCRLGKDNSALSSGLSLPQIQPNLRLCGGAFSATQVKKSQS